MRVLKGRHTYDGFGPRLVGAIRSLPSATG
jgi:hypothetical protein